MEIYNVKERDDAGNEEMRKNPARRERDDKGNDNAEESGPAPGA